MISNESNVTFNLTHKDPELLGQKAKTEELTRMRPYSDHML